MDRSFFSGPAPRGAYRFARLQAAALLLMLTLLLAWGAPNAQAAPNPTSINVVPTITSIQIVNGQLVASGTATAVIHGKTYTAAFQNVPVNISLAADQSAAAAAGCPILDLRLGPIFLDLLGLEVQTSPICLTITAYHNGGLLGDLLCDVANLLNGGLTLSQVLAGQGTATLPGLTSSQISSLLSGLTDLFNAALPQLLQAVLQSIQIVDQGHTCSILHLALGPIDLTLLGLNVHLDNCSNGPVTVDITAVTGQSNLLGNLLCQLVDGNQLSLGSTLQQILNQLVALLTG